ncbi:uncharacterized protein H6S33_004839 [Morchella sextelata]|uniref:uncharacterized protein n=1 Tax=Morchella sextelata TaxID=1174677 RepID=UPI001D0393FC|nr:uncharacterized protein H6S33_004839 [Morchella sextelata]KAH0605617.1 hypothetical protein H6S33_004839 [Morchella sextelata]
MPSSLLPSPPASPTPQYPPPGQQQQQPSRRKRAAFSSGRVIPSLRRHETMLFGDPLKTVPCQSQDNCSFESLSGSSTSSGSADTSQDSIRTEAC